MTARRDTYLENLQSWKALDFMKACVMATILLCNGMMFVFLVSYLHQQQPPNLNPSAAGTGTGREALQEARLTLMHEEIQQLRNDIIEIKQQVARAHPHEINSPPSPDHPSASDEKTHNYIAPSDFVHVEKHLFPYNTSLFDEYTSPIVDQDRKVIFCWMAKNSCSKFKRLFAYAAQGWNAMEKISMIKFDHQIHQHHELFRQLNAYSEDEVNDMMNDDSWSRVAFIRDPLERWMSAFSEKCRISKKNPDENSACFGKSVEEFVEQLYKHHEKIDPCDNHDNDSHFFPQWCECDLWKDHKKWTIYRFDKKNRAGQIDHFLNNFGFEEYITMFQTSTSHRTKANKTELLKEIEGNPQTKKHLLALLERDYKTFFPDLWPPF